MITVHAVAMCLYVCSKIWLHHSLRLRTEDFSIYKESQNDERMQSCLYNYCTPSCTHIHRLTTKVVLAGVSTGTITARCP